MNYFKIDNDLIIDFKDNESIKNTILLYDNIFENKAISFIINLNCFIFMMKIFNLNISLIGEKDINGKYNVKNLLGLLKKKENVFSVLDNDKSVKYY